MAAMASQIPNSGLDKHVPPQCTANLNSPDATMLGTAQRQQFEADLAASTATFKLVINEPFEYVCLIHPSMKGKIVLSG